MKSKIVIFILLLATMLISACGAASGELTIQNAWARPANTGENGAAYFMIENGTASDDTLMSASSDIASAAEVHMSMGDANGVMSMQMQEAVTIPAGEPVEFKPGGLHVMLVNLTRDLKPGDTITLTLNFKGIGNVVVEVPVKEP
jgi:copper(I)-binding protein